MPANASRYRHIRERSIAVVAKELAWQRPIVAWMTVRPLTRSRVATKRLAGRVPLAVVDNQQIEPAIPVIVEPKAVNAPHLSKLGMRTIKARRVGNIREGSIPIVSKKRIAVHSCY